jgi:hypothetical protein
MSIEDNDMIVQHSFEVSFTRIIGDIVIPTRLSVKAEVAIDDTTTDENVDLLMTKVQYWIDHCMARSVIFCPANTLALEMMLDGEGSPRTSNLLMLTPDEPSDDHLAVILQAKLSALGDDMLIFGSVELKSDNSSGLTFTYIGDNEDILPSMGDWVPGPNWFSVPWWHRNDVSMIDTVPSPDTDLTDTPGWATNFDFLTKRETASAVIVKGEFRPQVIDGGKRDT